MGKCAALKVKCCQAFQQTAGVLKVLSERKCFGFAPLYLGAFDYS
jgi:hypothetical protein